MKYIYKFGVLAAIFLMLNASGLGQDCLPPAPENNIKGGDVVLIYGATTNAVNPQRASNIILGQPLVQQSNNTKNVVDLGFYSQFLLQPLAPTVTASQGEFLDRIQVNWSVDPLGASATEGFNIYRDGIFIDKVGPNVRNYNDFNVIAGTPYVYEIQGLNQFGEGSTGSGLGFQIPNGVVTGKIQTLNGNPVIDAQVNLTPLQGFSIKLEPEDGFAALHDSGYTPFIPDQNNDWTVAFWVRPDANPNPDANILSMSGSDFCIKGSTADNTISVSQQSSLISAPLLPSEWHHVAFSYEGISNNGRLYVDGQLIGTSPVNQIVSPDTLFFGHRSGIDGWSGQIDEFRIYNNLLNEIDLKVVMEGTASSNTPFLTHYWKFDEELGEKSFDILSRQPFYLCGATFDSEIPSVRVAGMTNEDGFYQIEGVNYGTGTTFIAQAEKDFIMHRSLEFKANENDLVTLPNFALPPKSTLEFWIYNVGIAPGQTFFSKLAGSNNIKVLIAANNELRLAMNSGFGSFGTLPPGYNHIAFTIDSTTNQVTGYINGTNAVTHTIPVPSNWSDNTNWYVGANVNDSQYFDGLIDEVAIYDTLLPSSAIFSHSQAVRDMTEEGLMVYFPFDEGSGVNVYNVGSLELPPGTVMGAEWSTYAGIQETEPHEFVPGTRQVTINPSVTSVDQIDFTDRSTIPVSGFVRYQGTDCFQANVEIYVNGESFSPAIFTDSTGRFIVDFEPGFSGVLTPNLEGQTFSPAAWEIVNISSPQAGILFNNTVKRQVSGRVAGGLCELPILENVGQPNGTICKVQLRSTDGCYEKVITLNNASGNFMFNDLPPLENFTIAVIEHSDPDIQSYFNVEGGSTLDLSVQDTMIKLLYFAPPEVEIVSGLDPFSPTCDVIVLDKGQQETISIAMKEVYIGGECAVDTGIVRIINGFSEEVSDTTISNGSVDYTFIVGDPNPSPPYLKTIQIIGTSLTGRESTITKQGIVTGVRNKENTFTSVQVGSPILVLRDPPGDGSSAYFEKEETICQNTEFHLEFEDGIGIDPEFHLGGDVTIVAAPAGVGTIVNTGIIFDVGVDTEFRFSTVNDSTWQYCLTTNERIATDDGDLLVGKDSDIFMGLSTNIIFGFADKVDFDTTSCGVSTSEVLNIEPDNSFASSYVYTRFQIENYLIPNLRALEADSAQFDENQRLEFKNAADRWMVDLQASLDTLERTNFEKNISFSSGVEYEYSMTSEELNSSLDEDSNSQTIEPHTTIGWEFKKAGFTVTLKRFVGRYETTSTGLDSINVVTTGYVLSDDDPGDALSVDVGIDKLYQTPVFKTKAGQTSCPWEPGTANREAPNLQLAPGSQFVATDVPANEPAVFQFQLGNLSATNEDWTYSFGALPASNPHGAVIKLNGQPLNGNSVDYIIPYGTSQLVTLTVEKGPIEYDYDSLLVALYSGCEYERNFALSIPVDDDPKFFSPIYIGAHFIRPCSEVNITAPQQDWVIYNSTETPEEMNITVSGYNRQEMDFQLIRVQYRRKQGNGTWINLPGTFEKYNTNWKDYNGQLDTLGHTFTQFTWNTAGLSDGDYELRAIAICTGDAQDKPGFSRLINGRIDREAPSLLGFPQPSDGVYHVGDEISFTFNQDINCDKLILADLVNENNVGLYDSSTDELIDVSLSCKDNKIIIDPNFVNAELENKVLRAELHDIEDLVGNTMNQYIWEFYVDRNELAWLEDTVSIVKYDDESKSVVVEMHNRGGYPVPFSLYNIPEDIHVYPTSGTLVANEIEEIVFTMNEERAIGNYVDSIWLKTEPGANPVFMGGEELLILDSRVICRPPSWVINPASFDASMFNFSMNFILFLDIEGQLSTDEEDIVGAYVNGELRGISKVVYKPGLGHIAFLTAYSNIPSGETIEFQIWDASTCQLYADIIESFTFVDNTLIGSSTSPQTIHTSGKILRKIYLNPGWNWISMNLDLVDNSINGALSTVKNPVGATIKGQSSFSQYSTSLNQWVGSLNAVSPIAMYQYYSETKDSISMIGTQVDSIEIPIQTGWNWIGYIPNFRLSVNNALASLQTNHGDLIKSRENFAVFDTTLGWVGNLGFMDEPHGYLLYSSALDTLVYPSNSGNLQSQNPAYEKREGKGILEEFVSPYLEDTRVSQWVVDPSQYEYSMNVIAFVEDEEGQNILSGSDEIGVFKNEELRGSCHPVYIPGIDQYLLFLTVYGVDNGEDLSLKYFREEQAKIYDIEETIEFKINDIIGTIDAPKVLHVPGIVLSLGDQYLDGDHFYPNPFNNELHINTVHSEPADIYVRNVEGVLVYTSRDVVLKDGSQLIWKPSADVPNGVYYVEIQIGERRLNQKVIYIK